MQALTAHSPLAAILLMLTYLPRAIIYPRPQRLFTRRLSLHHIYLSGMNFSWRPASRKIIAQSAFQVSWLGCVYIAPQLLKLAMTKPKSSNHERDVEKAETFIQY